MYRYCSKDQRVHVEPMSLQFYDNNLHYYYKVNCMTLIKHCFFFTLNTQELTAYEKDLLLPRIICASINASEETLSMKNLKVGRKATRIRYFYYEHRRICRDTFLLLVDISKDKLTHLKKWYLANGIYPRKNKTADGKQL